MADSTDRAARGEEAGSAAHAQRGVAATSAATAGQAYRDFLDHAHGCADCITTGVDCEPAAELKRIWRQARAAA